MSASSPAPPLLLFAHGAGAPSSSPWMQLWRRRLATLGEVVPFDYPYLKAGRRAPDRPPVLIAAHRAALDDAVTSSPHGSHPDRPVVLLGKSMGSRIGCHLAVELAREGRPVSALVCFGYPLRGAGTGALRDQVLRELTTPIMFIQGTRDTLCSLDELEKVRAAMKARNELTLVEEGDHSLHLPRRRGLAAAAANNDAQESSDRRVLEAVKRFLSEVTSGTSAGPG